MGELVELLKPTFPEVSCEKLVSRHPELYSSFKVGIYEGNFGTAMDPALWPSNACIRRFLQLERRENRGK